MVSWKLGNDSKTFLYWKWTIPKNSDEECSRQVRCLGPVSRGLIADWYGISLIKAILFIIPEKAHNQQWNKINTLDPYFITVSWWFFVCFLVILKVDSLFQSISCNYLYVRTPWCGNWSRLIALNLLQQAVWWYCSHRPRNSKSE